ncbi:hypothetical protein [Hydrogenophaga sp.]|uniref:hypothetical protein n=1 Tax=Hydrogenophaga sp. TaxID=1904254 RepID=UPI003F7170AC
MRGHDSLISMRRAGQRPAMVFINDWPCKTDWLEHGDHATVSTAGDAIELLDLRFLVGLQVSVSSGDERRARALFDRCKAAGAALVAANHVQPEVQPHLQAGWTDIWTREVAHG